MSFRISYTVLEKQVSFKNVVIVFSYDKAE